MSAELPVPEDNTVYKLQSYWDDRFTAEAEYDWLVTFSQVEHILREHVRPTDRILVVGCGNSTFSRDLVGSARAASRAATGTLTRLLDGSGPQASSSW